MHNKNLAIIKLNQALIKRFGAGCFVPSDASDKLGANHVVFTSVFDKRIKLSVVVEEHGPRKGHYSIQVETNYGEPNFDIPVVKDNLSIEDVLNTFAAYQRLHNKGIQRIAKNPAPADARR